MLAVAPVSAPATAVAEGRESEPRQGLRGGAPGLALMADGDDQGSATVELSHGRARARLGGARRGAESVRPCVKKKRSIMRGAFSFSV